MVSFKEGFYYVQYFTIFLYIIIYLNIWNKAPQYLDVTEYFLHIFIGLMLIYYFNPLFNKNITFNDFHRNIAFSAGVFILTTLSLDAFTTNIKWIIQELQKYFTILL